MRERTRIVGAGRRLAAAVVAALWAAAAPLVAATLEIGLAAPDGTAVPIDRAEVLLAAWGADARVPLELDGPRAVVRLDEDWLREVWPESYVGLEQAFIYLEADGWAPVLSEPFRWPGDRQAHQGREVTTAEIAFRGGESARLERGEAGSLVVSLRRPQPRRLLLVDGAGEPVSGVEVQSFVYWTRANDCDLVAETHPLGEATSDAAGAVPVADGDFAVALTFDKEHWVVDDPRGLETLPPRAVIEFDGPEETVVLERLRSVPLDLVVIRGNRPVDLYPVEGCLAGCACGACCTEVGTTDAAGRLVVEKFFPAKWSELYVRDPARFKIWHETDPASWLTSGPPDRIELEP